MNDCNQAKSTDFLTHINFFCIFRTTEISEEKWKLAEQTRKFNKLRPFEQADYKKKHPNFEPVIRYPNYI